MFFKFEKQNSWFVSEKYKTDSKIHFIKKHENLWNEFWNSFHTFLKRITNSVSRKKFKICEIEFVIRFRKVWNGSQKSFHKKNMETSETDFEIRFILFWNGSRISFLKKKIPNGFWNPFCFFLKRITKYVSHNKKEKKYKTDINTQKAQRTWRRNEEEKEVVEIIGGATQTKYVVAVNDIYCSSTLFSPTASYKFISGKMVNLEVLKKTWRCREEAPHKKDH